MTGSNDSSNFNMICSMEFDRFGFFEIGCSDLLALELVSLIVGVVICVVNELFIFLSLYWDFFNLVANGSLLLCIFCMLIYV